MGAEVERLQWLKGRVPVPEVVCLDETRALVPYDFLIATRLSGAGGASTGAAVPAEACAMAATAASRRRVMKPLLCPKG